jgi:hypothetical protein
MIMKNVILILSILLFIGITSYSQTVTNGDFEIWSAGTVGENPDNWFTDNMDYLGLGLVIVERVYQDTSDPYEGLANARLETETENIMGTPYDVPGILSLATVDWDPINSVPIFSGGVATTNRPAHFRGYYKYTAAGSDSCFIFVTVTKWNTSNSQQDTIGTGLFKSAGAANWTLFEVPIDYLTQDIPDSCNVVISSSDYLTMSNGSVLHIDSVSFTGNVPVGINTHESIERLSVYPNPAVDVLNIMLYMNGEKTDLKVYNTIGKTVYQKTIEQARSYRTKLNISDLPKGIYFVEALSNQEKIVKKLVIK